MPKVRIKIPELLKLQECQKCPNARKTAKDKQLMCYWDGITPTPCIKVPDCGNWPEHLLAIDTITINT